MANNSSNNSDSRSRKNATRSNATRAVSVDDDQTSESQYSAASTARSMHSGASSGASSHSGGTSRSETRTSTDSRSSGGDREDDGTTEATGRGRREMRREDTMTSCRQNGKEDGKGSHVVSDVNCTNAGCNPESNDLISFVRCESGTRYESRDSDGKGQRGYSSDGGKAGDRRKPTTASSSPERGRQASSSSLRTKEDIEYDNKTLSMSRAEPKFEPRFSYNRRSRPVHIKKDSAYYSEHRKKISDAKPLIDNKPPPMFSHIHCNMKKLKKTQDRQDEIERANKLLLERLVKAMTTTRVDNWNDLDNRIVPSSRAKQRRQIVEVVAENRKILHRIDSRKSTVPTRHERRHDSGTQSSYQRRVELHRSVQQQQQGGAGAPDSRQAGPGRANSSGTSSRQSTDK